MKKASVAIALSLLFAAASLLFAATIPVKGYVSPEIGLNVRTSPGEGSPKIGALNQGTSVTIVAVTNGWYKISSPMSGYVHGSYVKVTEYGEAPDEQDSEDLSDESSIDEKSLTPEEERKIASDLDKSLKNVKFTKAPEEQ